MVEFLRASTANTSRPPIIRRKVRFDFDRVESPFFFAGNSVMSAVVVALSSVFPPGEKEFIASVRLFAGPITDADLQTQIADFIAQEGRHSALHVALNAAFDRLGYDASDATRSLTQEIDAWNAGKSPAERLAQTVVLEHITATMAHYALTHRGELRALLPSPVAELLLWHAAEEIEHKSVAFDVYRERVGEHARLCRILLRELVLFPVGMGTLAGTLLKAMGHRPSPHEYAEALTFLFGRDGLIASVLPQYLALLRPSFHPWDIADGWLVEQWKAERAGELDLPA